MCQATRYKTNCERNEVAESIERMRDHELLGESFYGEAAKG